MSEELAIVKGVGFGMRDCNAPVLWFGVETLNGGSLQVFNLDEAGKLIEGAACYDIKSLEGRACIVAKVNGMMRFKGWK